MLMVMSSLPAGAVAGVTALIEGAGASGTGEGAGDGPGGGAGDVGSLVSDPIEPRTNSATSMMFLICASLTTCARDRQELAQRRPTRQCARGNRGRPQPTPIRWTWIRFSYLSRPSGAPRH